MLGRVEAAFHAQVSLTAFRDNVQYAGYRLSRQTRFVLAVEPESLLSAAPDRHKLLIFIPLHPPRRWNQTQASCQSGDLKSKPTECLSPRQTNKGLRGFPSCSPRRTSDCPVPRASTDPPGSAHPHPAIPPAAPDALRRDPSCLDVHPPCTSAPRAFCITPGIASDASWSNLSSNLRSVESSGLVHVRNYSITPFAIQHVSGAFGTLAARDPGFLNREYVFPLNRMP